MLVQVDSYTDMLFHIMECYCISSSLKFYLFFVDFGLYFCAASFSFFPFLLKGCTLPLIAVQVMD